MIKSNALKKSALKSISKKTLDPILIMRKATSEFSADYMAERIQPRIQKRGYPKDLK